MDAGLGDDAIIGGSGNDSLTGGRGRDSLIGGTGLDSYYSSTGNGVDTIYDSDGQGLIFFNGVQVQVGARIAPNVWRSIDNTLVIERISSYSVNGAFDVRIRSSAGGEDSILIRGWSAGTGSLGLQLSDTPIQTGLTATIEGSADADELRGSAAYETIIWLGSGDILSGGAGDDVLFAGEQEDVESVIFLKATGFETLGLLSAGKGDLSSPAQ